MKKSENFKCVVSLLTNQNSIHEEIIYGLKFVNSCNIPFKYSLSSQLLSKKLKIQINKTVGKPTGKRPLGRPRRRWEDNIRMYLEEIDINASNWIDSAQDRNYWRALVNAALNLRGSIRHGVS